MWLVNETLLCGDWLGEIPVTRKLLWGEWPENTMLLWGDWLGLEVRLQVVTLFREEGLWFMSEVLSRRWREFVRDCRFSFSGRGGGPPSTLSCWECWDTSLLAEKKQGQQSKVTKFTRGYEKNLQKTTIYTRVWTFAYLRTTSGSFGSGGFGGAGSSPKSGGSLLRLQMLSWEREAGKLGLSYTPISPVLSRISFSRGVSGRSGREARLLL